MVGLQAVVGRVDDVQHILSSVDKTGVCVLVLVSLLPSSLGPRLAFPPRRSVCSKAGQGKAAPLADADLAAASLAAPLPQARACACRPAPWAR